MPAGAVPGTLKYAKAFKRAQVERGYFTKWDYICSYLPHAAVCLMPNSLRSLVYRFVLRKSDDAHE